MKILRFILREKNVLRDLIFLSFYFLSFKEERRRGFFIPPSGWTRSRLDTIIIFPLFEAKLRFQFYSPVPFFITLVCKSSSFEYVFPSFDVYSFYGKLLAARRCNNPFATGSRNFPSYMRAHTHYFFRLQRSRTLHRREGASYFPPDVFSRESRLEEEEQEEEEVT